MQVRWVGSLALLWAAITVWVAGLDRWQASGESFELFAGHVVADRVVEVPFEAPLRVRGSLRVIERGERVRVLVVGAGNQRWATPSQHQGEVHPVLVVGDGEGALSAGLRVVDGSVDVLELVAEPVALRSWVEGLRALVVVLGLAGIVGASLLIYRGGGAWLVVALWGVALAVSYPKGGEPGPNAFLLNKVLGHGLGFCVVGVLVGRWQAAAPWEKALLLVGIAVASEAAQTLTSTRSGSPRDAAIDLVGAALGWLIASYFFASPSPRASSASPS